MVKANCIKCHKEVEIIECDDGCEEVVCENCETRVKYEPTPFHFIRVGLITPEERDQLLGKI